MRALAATRQLVLVLLLGLLLVAQQCSGLRAESAALKRKKKKKLSSDQRQLNESAPRQQTDYVQSAVSRYLSNTELTARLQDLEQRCKHIAVLNKIGSSAAGRPIWALEISDKPGQVEAEPNVKYIGNIHGDEPTGRVLTLALAEWLCANYRSDPRAKRIVQSMHLWLVPTMNPDGFQASPATRENIAGRDLNRDFPDRFNPKPFTVSGSEQPETKAVMEWSLRVPFVAAATMHEGALVANYPWDGTPDHSTAYQACPDDSTFKHLASVYATSHKRMSRPDNSEFPNGGITNGAAWYPIYGSMQDWSYVVGGCMELTLELCPYKYPADSELAGLWEDNRDALLAFPLAAAYGGLWGSVREEGKPRAQKGQEFPPLAGANITVVGIDRVVTSRPTHGDYYRPLAPGRYSVLVSRKGYKPFTTNLTIPADGSGAQRHFILAREGSSGQGRVAFSIRTLGSNDGSSSSETSGVLPWRANGDKPSTHHKDMAAVAAEGTRLRDHLLMLGVGGVVVYGLWLTHSRLQRRAHLRKA